MRKLELLKVGLAPLLVISCGSPILYLLLGMVQAARAAFIIGPFVLMVGAFFLFVWRSARSAVRPQLLFRLGAISVGTGVAWTAIAWLVEGYFVMGPRFFGTPLEDLFNATLGWPFIFAGLLMSWINPDNLLNIYVPSVAWILLTAGSVTLPLSLILFGVSIITAWVVKLLPVKRVDHQPPTPTPQPP